MTNEPRTPIQPANFKRRCTATCADGSPCRAWAVRTSDPPRCAPHGGGRARVGAPAGNQNAVTHSYYSSTAAPPWAGEPACSIDAVIADLYARHQLLSRYIDENMDHLSTAEFIRLTSLHGQSASRLGRLLRDRRVLEPAEDGMSSAIEQALKELGEEWGVDLVGTSGQYCFSEKKQFNIAPSAPCPQGTGRSYPSPGPDGPDQPTE